MALIGGGYRHNLTGKLFGGTNLDGANPSFHVWRQHMTARGRNITASEAIMDDLLSVPSGNRHPSAWIMPRKPGGLSSGSNPVARITLTASGVYGRNLSASVPLEVAINQAALALVVGGVASISMNLSVDNPMVVGALFAETSFQGLGFTMVPTLGAESGLGSTVTMTFTPIATATALASASATISGEGEAVTPNSVASAVWNSVAAVYNVAGTMGNKMNSAASAGDPWTTPLPGGYLAGTAGQIIGTLQNDINLHTDAALVDIDEEVDKLAFNSHVHIDTVDGASGTAFPLGTLSHPVDNLADALTIAYANGFGEISVKNALTVLASDQIDNLKITSDYWPEVTLNPGVAMENTVFERLSINGEFEGYWNILFDCWTYTATNFCGWVRGGSISDLTLAPGSGLPEEGVSFFDDLVPLFPGTPASVTMNTDTDVSFTGCSDHIILKGMTAGSIATVGLRGGQLTIDASCTGGTISASGTGSVINNSALTIDTSGLAASSADLDAGVNVAKLNGFPVIGDGTDGNSWRGDGVSP